MEEMNLNKLQDYVDDFAKKYNYANKSFVLEFKGEFMDYFDNIEDLHQRLKTVRFHKDALRILMITKGELNALTIPTIHS